MIVTPQHDYGEELGQALGGGFSSGANQLMKFKLQSMLRESMKAKEAQKPFFYVGYGPEFSSNWYGQRFGFIH